MFFFFWTPLRGKRKKRKEKKTHDFFFLFFPFSNSIETKKPIKKKKKKKKKKNRSVKNAYDRDYDVQSWFQLRGFLMQSFGSWNAEAPYTSLGGKADYATGITGVTQWQSAAEPASN